MAQEDIGKKDGAAMGANQYSPIGSDGYSVFLPQDVRTNLAAYRSGDEVAGNTLFQNLYKQNQDAALSLVDNNNINHDGMLGVLNGIYGIKDDGYVDYTNESAMKELMNNKKNGQVSETDIQKQQEMQANSKNNIPGGSTDSTLAILHRR